MTEKQISLLKKLILENKKNLLVSSETYVKDLNLEGLQREEKLIPFKKFLDTILDKISQDAFKEMNFYEKEEKTQNALYDLLTELLRSKEATMNFIEKEETANPIPQSFLTLREMRKALLYVA